MRISPIPSLRATNAGRFLALCLIGFTLVCPCLALEPAKVVPLGSKVANRISDVLETTTPSAIHIDGWLGNRISINEKNRLLTIEIEPMLAGFQKKPGNHAWIGEHVGKWMHAATLAWANTGDAALRAKLDHVAKLLISAQEADGYLGTYVPEKRFGLYQGADWDVWSHKYCLIGLLTYYQYTGDASALAAARKAADLLIRTFPAQKSILAAGTHEGMAATSVLEPIVLLYRLTGDTRYLEFAHYIVTSWDEPKGPAVLKSLLTVRRVDKTANAKAYEMLSNLVGLCDLARVTGDRSYIEASLNAWKDIVENRLYITGSTSAWEHFHEDHLLPNDISSDVGETCVSTTWIQFNLSLLQLTGEARFGDELERCFYNHLTAAQHPGGSDWCYYTALEGKKHYDKEITCCHSSGPRGIALIPQCSYLLSHENGIDTALINTLENSSAQLTLGGEIVTLEQRSGFPRTGESSLTIKLEKSARFALKIRLPTWALPASVDGREVDTSGWATIAARTWKNGDSVPVKFTLAAREVTGTYGNEGRAALAWGPFVLAYERNPNPTLARPGDLGLTDLLPPFTLNPGNPLSFSTQLVDKDGRINPAKVVPFADAGADKGEFRIWLYAPGRKEAANDNFLLKGKESRSREGNLKGSINDDDANSLVCTYDGKLATEDWYAVTLPSPMKAQRFVVMLGKLFPNGGWFDTSAGKPRVQIQRGQGDAWETVGELKNHPETNAVQQPDDWNMRPGRPMLLLLDTPVEFVAVRVIGKPSSGNDPKQAFSSCAELQAFIR